MAGGGGAQRAPAGLILNMWAGLQEAEVLGREAMATVTPVLAHARVCMYVCVD